MKTITGAKKITSIILTVVSMLCMIAAMPPSTHADTANALVTLIESFGHGGEGSLFASCSNANLLTVTGTVTGASGTLSLNINAKITVIWAADYTGTDGPLIELSGSGTFEIQWNGTIRQTGNVPAPAIQCNGTNTVNVHGTVSSESCAAILVSGAKTVVNVYSGTVMCKRGSAIVLDGAGARLNVSGGDVACLSPKSFSTAVNVGSTTCKVTISGGFVFSMCKTQIYGTGDGTVIKLAAASQLMINGTGVLCAWNTPIKPPTYTAGSSTDLVVNEGVNVFWANHPTYGYTCIAYKCDNSDTGSVYEIAGVTVKENKTRPYTA